MSYVYRCAILPSVLQYPHRNYDYRTKNGWKCYSSIVAVSSYPSTFQPVHNKSVYMVTISDIQYNTHYTPRLMIFLVSLLCAICQADVEQLDGLFLHNQKVV